MSQKNETKTWTKPELTKLGKLVDVAPGTASGTRQGANSRT
jgi:hypothetical protein